MGITLGLVFLLLGPTTLSLLHDHAVERVVTNANTEKPQLYEATHHSPCPICSFSFSSFLPDPGPELVVPRAIQVSESPIGFRKHFRASGIPVQRIPRGPPVVSRYR
jgi:hypothetical protein